MPDLGPVSGRQCQGGGAAMRRMETYCVLDVVVVLRRPGCELEKLHSGFHDILPRDVDVGGRIGR